ncbi:MAG: heavy-metal-associated domain-containing protein, partial [Syntrophales bacterium]|nr:heavy-metal-associated domain-containing protein [Syntrophales bacterium]
MQNIEFSVKDMDCKSCVNIIMKKLKSFEGVKNVKVDPVTKKVVVQWDNPKVCDSDLTCAIEDLGYKGFLDVQVEYDRNEARLGAIQSRSCREKSAEVAFPVTLPDARVGAGELEDTHGQLVGVDLEQGEGQGAAPALVAAHVTG